MLPATNVWVSNSSKSQPEDVIKFLIFCLSDSGEIVSLCSFNLHVSYLNDVKRLLTRKGHLYTVDPWTMWVWAVWVPLHIDFFPHIYSTALQMYFLLIIVLIAFSFLELILLWEYSTKYTYKICVKGRLLWLVRLSVKSRLFVVKFLECAKLYMNFLLCVELMPQPPCYSKVNCIYICIYCVYIHTFIYFWWIFCLPL